MDFTTIGLQAELLRGLEDLGFESPTPIQAAALPELLATDRDFIGLAQTGTGKTAAFGLPLLQRVDRSKAAIQGVILCPTRELCLQITDDLKGFARYLSGIRIAAVYGGASMATQVHQLRRGAQIVVATPGRLLDLMRRKAANLSRLTCCVLDEADEMLNMGFKEELDGILEQMPAGRSTWLFSATMPSGVAAIAKTYLDNPHNVSVDGGQRMAANIVHHCYIMNERHRYPGLKRIVDFIPDLFGLVFCRTRKETQEVADALMQDGYSAQALHGDMSQIQRDQVMRSFRRQSIRILVATDVAARGLDVDDISHIIHYNLPDDPATYTHRSGRTARAGRSGISIALATPRETFRLRTIERANKIRFTQKKFPDGQAICERQCAHWLEQFVNKPVDAAGLADYLPMVSEALGGLDREELILRLMAGDLQRFAPNHQTRTEIDARPRPDKYTRTKPGRRHNANAAGNHRFFINVGRLDKIKPGAIVRLVCHHAGIGSDQIGRIELKREFSFFEVADAAAGTILRGLKNVQMDGRPVQVKSAGSKAVRSKRKRRAA